VAFRGQIDSLPRRKFPLIDSSHISPKISIGWGGSSRFQSSSICRGQWLKLVPNLKVLGRSSDREWIVLVLFSVSICKIVKRELLKGKHALCAYLCLRLRPFSYSTVDCLTRKDSSLSCIPVDDQKRWLINCHGAR
jgi:hypothetical protein